MIDQFLSDLTKELSLRYDGSDELIACKLRANPKAPKNSILIELEGCRFYFRMPPELDILALGDLGNKGLLELFFANLQTEDGSGVSLYGFDESYESRALLWFFLRLARGLLLQRVFTKEGFCSAVSRVSNKKRV